VEERVNYALVGLFVVVLAGALAATTAWLAASRGQKTYETYVAYTGESVSGLNAKAPVKYRGVVVGQVRDIALDRDSPERVRLLLDIEQGTPIKVDTVAVLATQGVTGIAFVDLTGGRREAAALQAAPGERFPEIRTGPSLLMRIDTAVTTLLAQLGQVTQDLGRVATRVSALLEGENLAAAVGGTLHNLEAITRVLAGRVGDIGDGIRDGRVILANGVKISQDLPALMSRVNDSAASIQEAMANVNRAATGVDRAVSETRRDLARASGSTVTQVEALLVELQQLTRTMQRLGGELERDPNMLLFGRRGRERGPGE